MPAPVDAMINVADAAGLGYRGQVVLQVYTATGVHVVFLRAAEAAQLFTQAAQVARAAKSGLIVPGNGQRVDPP